MPSTKGYRSAINYVFWILYWTILSTASRDKCEIDFLGSRLITSVQMVKHTVHIIASVASNTTLDIDDILTIPVYNAPTNLDVVTTYDTESTFLSMANPHATASTSSYVDTDRSFSLMLVALDQLSPKRKRQGGSMLSYTGRATTSCSQASSLSLTSGQLLITYANGTVAQFSASVGQPYISFSPSTTPGNLTTTFSLSTSGTLLWTNDAFFNGGANFCVLPSGVIIAVLQQGAQPTSCVFVALTIVELSACPVTGTGTTNLPTGNQIQPYQGPTGMTGPSGPAGSVGPSGPSGGIGPSGPPGAVGPTGPAGGIGPSGPAGAVGASGISGLSGAIGPTGPSGGIGPSGPSGPAGPTGAPGFAYAWLGCFYQGTASGATTGHVLSLFVATYTSSANIKCSTYCNNLNYNFYGTVNIAGPPASADCYCGDVLNYVTVVGLGNGMAPDNNCGLCSGGPAPAGQCGVQTSSTIAIFARAF